MIVPEYWAEARIQHRKAGKQVTVRRFGWSNTSQEDARKLADQRAQEALERILSGKKLERRERKVSYNGSEGVPIREEVLQRHGDSVISRNSYGAWCLNTPNVLFADVDFEDLENIWTRTFSMFLVGLIGAVGGVYLKSYGLTMVGFFGGLVVGGMIHRFIHRLRVIRSGGEQGLARRRIEQFLEMHPKWKVRLYRTPAGLRVLAIHKTFEPNDPEVEGFFKALHVDTVYRGMCKNQQCFRARLTAKPWRIGIEAHMRPRPGVWPVNPEKKHLREAWVAEYEEAAKSFAACRYLETLGTGMSHPDVRPVQELHDRLSKAESDLPIA
jgi:hypothetical protein